MTDPQRYIIVQQRVQAWVDVLVAQLGAVASAPIEVVSNGRPGREFTLVFPRPGTFGVHVRYADEPMSLARVSVALPAGVPDPEALDAVSVGVPHCGCDACDDGSDEQLDAVDWFFDSVVSGNLLLLKGQGWLAYATPNAAGGVPADENIDLAEVIHALRAGLDPEIPAGCTAELGESWIE